MASGVCSHQLLGANEGLIEKAFRDCLKFNFVPHGKVSARTIFQFSGSLSNTTPMRRSFRQTTWQPRRMRSDSITKVNL